MAVYIDGSVLENKEAGAAFFIPSWGINKQFYIGKYYSIFTVELIAILAALNYIYELKKTWL